jgi:hypothetical protein
MSFSLIRLSLVYMLTTFVSLQSDWKTIQYLVLGTWVIFPPGMNSKKKSVSLCANFMQMLPSFILLGNIYPQWVAVFFMTNAILLIVFTYIAPYPIQISNFLYKRISK